MFWFIETSAGQFLMQTMVQSESAHIMGSHFVYKSFGL